MVTVVSPAVMSWTGVRVSFGFAGAGGPVFVVVVTQGHYHTAEGTRVIPMACGRILAGCPLVRVTGLEPVTYRLEGGCSVP